MRGIFEPAQHLLRYEEGLSFLEDRHGTYLLRTSNDVSLPISNLYHADRPVATVVKTIHNPVSSKNPVHHHQ